MLALCACGGRAGEAGTSPQAVADATTKAIYADDLNAMQTRFDAALKSQVTLGEVSTISSKLRALGAYKGLTQTAADAPKGRYDFTAAFDRGTLAVHLRLDPDGRIGAYRVDIPNSLPGS